VHSLSFAQDVGGRPSSLHVPALHSCPAGQLGLSTPQDAPAE